MNVYELVDALDGEIVGGKAKVRVDGTWVVVGRIIDDALALTEEGEQLVAEMLAKKTAKLKKPGVTKPATDDAVTKVAG